MDPDRVEMTKLYWEEFKSGVMDNNWIAADDHAPVQGPSEHEHGEELGSEERSLSQTRRAVEFAQSFVMR